MVYPIDGILLIDKGEGETSHGVVQKVRSSLGGVKVRKVGHAGTLDPFATGLLIILLGQGTKLSRFIMSEDKRYVATLRLGIETDTLDSTGRIIRTCHVPALSGGYIREKTRGFVGHIRQVPPMYSAVKYRGTRAYQLARKGLQIALPGRTVTVSSFRIVSVQLPRVTMEVCCSGGTYIRSLAADFGKRLGPGGHLTALRRLASGPFEVENALGSNEISKERGDSLIEQKVIPMREALPRKTEVAVGELLARKIRQGYQPAWEELAPRKHLADSSDRHIKVVCRDELVAIMKISGNREAFGGQMKIERVFPGLVGLNENS